MTFKMLVLKIYPVVGPSPTCGLSFADQIMRVAAGMHASLTVQVRNQGASPRAFCEEAAKAVSIGQKLGLKMVIHRRMDIAIAVGADGVHLEQDDLPSERARAVMGDSAIIGVSAHTVDQAVLAASEPVDYVAIGPIFQSDASDSIHPPVGLEAITQIKVKISRPSSFGNLMISKCALFAFGGITLENVRSVIEAGAGSAMISSDLHATGDITARLRHLFTQVSRDR
jgi:thiamine-phosphate pyrophosphorylase